MWTSAGASRREEDVLGLEVAVDRALVVGGLEGVTDLAGHFDGERRGERLAAREEGGEGLAVEQLHRDVEEAVGGAPEAVDADHVGVAEPARGAGLVIELPDGGPGPVRAGA